MRAYLSDRPVPARQGDKRLARALARPWLTPACLTPRPGRAALALALVPDARPTLALDSVRLGRWEGVTVGLVWHRRVLVVGWAVLPSPWPQGTFTPTGCALLEQVATAWPADRAAPALLADRGFPRKRFFATRARLRWGVTVRLRATDVVAVAGGRYPVRHLIERATAGTVTAGAATSGSGRPATAGTRRDGRVQIVEDWTADRLAVWVDGALLEERPNPYEVIPYVVFANIREAKGFWGVSDIEPLKEPAREINRALHDLGETPRTAFGENRSALSGVALNTELDPLLKKVERKWVIRAAAYRRRAELVLRLLEKFTGEKFAPYRARVVWGPALPQDRSRQVADERALVEAGIHSRKWAADNLGVEDPEGEYAQWLAEEERARTAGSAGPGE
jgi:hypothetical protein